LSDHPILPAPIERGRADKQSSLHRQQRVSLAALANRLGWRPNTVADDFVNRLAGRTSVITLGAGCSITSAATVSTTGATGRFIFRAAFFTGARLGLALAIVRFAAFATLRALPRLADFAPRTLARLCTFDPFLRLAMIFPPVLGGASTRALTQHGRVPATKPIELSTDRVVGAPSSPLHLAQTIAT
jgi:hypothetical protein